VSSKGSVLPLRVFDIFTGKVISLTKIQSYLDCCVVLPKMQNDNVNLADILFS
jgi:hypothetical protein